MAFEFRGCAHATFGRWLQQFHFQDASFGRANHRRMLYAIRQGTHLYLLALLHDGIILAEQHAEEMLLADRRILAAAITKGTTQEDMTRRFRPSLPPSLAVLAVCDLLLLSGCFTVSAWWTQSSNLDPYLVYQADYNKS